MGFRTTVIRGWVIWWMPLEVWGLNILADAPHYIGESANKVPIVRNHREFMATMAQYREAALVSLGFRCAFGPWQRSRGWRTYVPSSTDEPDKPTWKEIVRHAKAGQMMMTTGPFLEVQTEDVNLRGCHPCSRLHWLEGQRCSARTGADRSDSGAGQ